RCDDAVSRTGRGSIVTVWIFAANCGSGVRGGGRMVPWTKCLAARARRCHDGFCNAWALAGDAWASGPRRKALTTAEEAVKQPAVEAAGPSRRRARGGDRLHWRGRYRPRAVAEQSREETATTGRTRQACDRYALMGAAHEPAPDLDRQAAPRHVFCRRAIIIAEPDAGHEMRGIADEPGIAEILRRSGFPCRGPAWQCRLVRGADCERLGHHLVHHRHVTCLDDAAELARIARIEHPAIRGGDLLDDMRDQCVAAVGECRIGTDKLQHRDFRGAKGDRGIGLEL